MKFEATYEREKKYFFYCFIDIITRLNTLKYTTRLALKTHTNKSNVTLFLGN